MMISETNTTIDYTQETKESMHIFDGMQDTDFAEDERFHGINKFIDMMIVTRFEEITDINGNRDQIEFLTIDLTKVIKLRDRLDSMKTKTGYSSYDLKYEIVDRLMP